VVKGDTFVNFYVPSCNHCNNLAPTWAELAKAFANDEEVKIAEVDCTEHKALCQEHDVSVYPTLAYFRCPASVAGF
jgi:thioredoxin-like negative regulator of GroEL